MRVAVIGWLKGKPHPCKGYGGIEKTVAVVCTELARQGHTVTLIAPAGSIGNGYEVIETSDMTEATHICNDLDVDVVHDNTCWDLESPVRQGLKHPHISVTHVNHAIGYTHNVVYLSRSQRTQHGQQADRNLENSPVIYVPINPALKPKDLPKKGYLLYLGSIVEHKGVREAAQVAMYLHRELVVAGIATGDYANKVANMPNVRMVGEVSDPYRSELLEQAFAVMCCFNNYNGWQEPCSGVVGESYAFNTPVAAFNHACLPELVSPTEGWVADNAPALGYMMYNSIKNDEVKDFSLIQREFSAERIVQQYITLYERVIQGGTWG